MEEVKKTTNKIKISEEEIDKFIKENDKRKETVLIDYKDLIIRLLGTGISKKKIYDFIYEKDNSIGSQINFYKYIERNIENKTKKKPTNKEPKEAPKQTETIKPIATSNKEIKEPLQAPKTNLSATDKLSKEYDLLDGIE